MASLTYVDGALPFTWPEVSEGQDWSWSVALQNPDGSAQDLTGMQFQMQMRESTRDSEIVFTPTATVAGNVVTMTIPNATTKTVTQSKRLVTDFWQIDSLGNRQPLLRGDVQFKTSVTRS